MTKFTVASTGTLAAVVALRSRRSPRKPIPRRRSPPRRKPAMAVAHKPAAAARPLPPTPDLTKQYCIGCHSEKGKAGGLSLARSTPRTPISTPTSPRR